MIQAMKDFMTGIRSLAGYWQVWLAGLMGLNMALPLVYIEHPEAQYTLAAAMTGGGIGLVLVKVQGFTRLLGLMHLPWVVLMFYLWNQLPLHPEMDGFGLWLRLVLLANGLSLIIDTVDVVRYIAGERQPLVEPAP